MDPYNIVDLIKIREYIVTCVNNMHLDRSSLNNLNKLLPILDKKIISIILSDEFKNLL